MTWPINRNTPTLHLCHIFHISHSIDIIFMEYDSLSRCLDGEMVDTRDSKSRAKERGGSSPLQGIIRRMLIEWAFPVEVFRKSAPGALLYLLRSLTISLRKVDSKSQNRLNIAWMILKTNPSKEIIKNLKQTVSYCKGGLKNPKEVAQKR